IQTKAFERYLREPFVHLALDPEFATRRLGVAPGISIGGLEASSINQVQQYLDSLVAAQHLPKKVLILHQFRADMLPDAANIHALPNVERVVDMDGFGPPGS